MATSQCIAMATSQCTAMAISHSHGYKSMYSHGYMSMYSHGYKSMYRHGYQSVYRHGYVSLLYSSQQASTFTCSSSLRYLSGLEMSSQNSGEVFEGDFAIRCRLSLCDQCCQTSFVEVRLVCQDEFLKVSFLYEPRVTRV